MASTLDKFAAGELIKQKRLRLNMTQEDVARAAGIPTITQVSEYEAGQVNVARSKYFPRIAQTLGLSEDEIRSINPAAVFELAGIEPGESSGATPANTAPVVLIPPNLRQALDILSAEDAAYGDQIFAEKLALMDPEDGNADPPVTWWLELAPVIMRRYRRR